MAIITPPLRQNTPKTASGLVPFRPLFLERPTIRHTDCRNPACPRPGDVWRNGAWVGHDNIAYCCEGCRQSAKRAAQKEHLKRWRAKRANV